MRNAFRLWCGGLSVALVCALSACAAKRPVTPSPGYEVTPMPTVPPYTPSPPPTPAPIRTRPIGTGVKPTKGEPIGPIISFFGAARADGTTVQPIREDKGIPVYLSQVGSGFMIVVEAKPGLSGLEPGRTVFLHVPDDPTARPDLEIQTNRDMGNGSRAVCDRRRPKIGGIPRINPPSFKETQRIADTLNDFSCRFETFIESDSCCTMNKNGDYSYVASDSTTQFCMIVARAYMFPVGKTLLSVRLRDAEGNPGPVKRMWIEHPRPKKVKKTTKKKG